MNKINYLGKMIYTKDLLLRDFTKKDITKRIYWEIKEKEWQYWDAPWEYTNLSIFQKINSLKRYIQRMNKWAKHYKSIPCNEKRNSFQIVINNSKQDYIGWVTSYRLDKDYISSSLGIYCAIGIDIPEKQAQGKGYSYQALSSFIDYLLTHGENDIYLQTWSGNERMIHISKKMGFEVCDVKNNIRIVNGRHYDALTYKLNYNKYNSFHKTIKSPSIVYNNAKQFKST